MTTKPRSAFWAFPRRLASDTRGFTLVIMAAALTALVGFAGLGVETGLWYMIKRYNQSAADVGALSGIMELAAGKSYSDICSLAVLAAKANGFTFAGGWSCPASSPTLTTSCTSLSSGQACVNNPPLFGTYATNPKAVEVILAQTQNTFFASLALPSVTIDTRAVAAIENVSTCLIALSTKGTDLDYKGGGFASLNIPNCAFASDSSDPASIDLRGNFKITAAAITTVGGYSIKGAAGTVSPAITTGAPAAADPYGSVTTGTVPSGACTPDPNVSSGTAALVPGKAYCSITISGGTVTIPAGVYYLVGTPGKGGGTPGNLSISGGTVTGSGVTFVLTAAGGVSAAGTVQITGGSGSLSAPTVSGLLPPSAAASVGLLIFQDPATSASSGSNTIATGCPSGINLTGAIDTSLTQDTLQGNPASCTACTELIAASFHMGGTPGLDTSGCAAVGTKTGNVSIIALAE